MKLIVFLTGRKIELNDTDTVYAEYDTVDVYDSTGKRIHSYPKHLVKSYPGKK